MSSNPGDKISGVLDDDDDESLSILDSLNDDNDIPSKNSDTRHASRNTASSTTTAKADDGYSRIEYYRALQGFLQALTEAAPLYLGERLRNPGIDESALRVKVGGLCKAHLNLVNKCLDVNKADPTDIMLRYQRRSLAKQIASLYKNSSIEEIEGLVEVSKEWSLSSEDFDNASAEYTSPDSMLNVKLALFGAAMKTNVNLSGLWCMYTPTEVISKLQVIAISLAKEVAFNWSKKSQISDQDNLFIAALPQCLEIAELAYKDMAIRELPDIEYIHSDPQFGLPQFEEAVDSMDMGYLGEARVLLLDRMRHLANNYLSKAELPSISLLDAMRWRSGYISQMDEVMAQCWNDTSDEFFEELSKMSDAERAAYAATHDKLELSKFLAHLMERLSDLECPLSDVEIDFDRVTEKARRHLAWVWAISDSLITARNEGTPED